MLPPASERTLPHKWLPKEAMPLYADPIAAEMYLFKTAEEKYANHALSQVKAGLEVMGFLLGEVFTHQGVEYTVVRDVATTDLEATSVSVRFDPEGFESLFASLECARFLTYWWAGTLASWSRMFLSSTISRPRRGCSTDLTTALVIDPVRKEMYAFCLSKGEVSRRKFLVYWDEFQNPYYGESVRPKKIRM